MLSVAPRPDCAPQTTKQNGALASLRALAHLLHAECWCAEALRGRRLGACSPACIRRNCRLCIRVVAPVAHGAALLAKHATIHDPAES